MLVPAATITEWGQARTYQGYQILASEAILFWVPVYGWAFFSNVFLFLAPFQVRRVNRGKGLVFAVAFLIFAAMSALIPYAATGKYPAGIRSILEGYYFWQFSILSSASVFAWMVWKKWFALVPSAVLLASLAYAPSYTLRATYRELTGRVRSALDGFDSNPNRGGAGNLNMSVESLSNSPAKSELTLAVIYAQTAIACDGRERITVDDQYRSLQMFVGLQEHPAEPGHSIQPSQWSAFAICREDNSDKENWIAGSDLTRDAVRRSRAHLENAEILAGLRKGDPSQPLPVTDYEELFYYTSRGLPLPLPRRLRTLPR